MKCSSCGQDSNTVWVGDGGRFLCHDCRVGKHRCKECSRYFSKNTDGVLTFTNTKDGWYCWDCLLNTPNNAEDEQNWIGYTAGGKRDRPKPVYKTARIIPCRMSDFDEPEPDYVWQICTVIFEEIKDAMTS